MADTTLVCASCRKPVERTWDGEEFQHGITVDGVACTAWPVVPLRVPGCEVDGDRIDTYGGEHYWHCAYPGTIIVDSTLMCEDHAGELGYGPKQEEYGYDPDDGRNPTPATGG